MGDFELFIIAACSIAGLFAIISSFVIKVLQGRDENVPVQRIISNKWRFPPKEDKNARRERWARVMGRDPTRTLARLQKPPAVTPPADVTPEQVLAEFVSADRLQQYRKAICGGQVAMSYLTAPQIQVGQSVASLLNTYTTTTSSNTDSAARAWRSAPNAKSSEEDSCAASTDFAPLDPSEVRRIKARVLRVLIEAGPARSLCPITEEKDDSWRPTHSSPSAQVGSWLCSSIRSAREKVTPVVDAELGLLAGRKPWRDGVKLGGGLGPKGREALLLDTEPIMMVGTKGVSREMLWLVLALVGGQSFRVEAETQAQMQWRPSDAPIGREPDLTP